MKFLFAALTFVTLFCSNSWSKTCKLENQGGLIGHQYASPYKLIVDGEIIESYKTINELIERINGLKTNSFCSLETAKTCSETTHYNSDRTSYTINMDGQLISVSTNFNENREVLTKLIALGICPK